MSGSSSIGASSGKERAAELINKTFDRQDVQKAVLEKKGIDLTDAQTRGALGVAAWATAQIESDFVCLNTSSDNGNNSNGMMQVGPGAKDATVQEFGIGKNESHTTEEGNMLAGILYWILGLGNSKDEKIDKSKLYSDSISLASGKSNPDNILVEASRDYNGGTDSGSKISATIGYGQKFADAYKTLANA